MKLPDEEQKELKAEIDRIVDLMVQVKSGQDSISSILKDIKENYEVPMTVTRKVATTIFKQTQLDEEQKWEEFTYLLEVCG